MSARTKCSCGRAEVELGCDLCACCRGDYERQQQERADEDRTYPDEDFYIRRGVGDNTE